MFRGNPVVMSQLAGETGRCRMLWALPVVLWLLSPWSLRAGPTRSLRAGETKTSPQRPSVQVQVDPRVELLSIIFCLSGDGMYNMGQVESYSNDVQEHFGPFRDHSVVTLARQLRNKGGLGVDGPMSMAVHVEDAYKLKEIVPFDEKPQHLDPRWTIDRAREFLQEARQFVRDTKFGDFIEEHRPLYRTTESRLEAFLVQYSHLEWFDEFFGKRPEASYTVVPALLNDGASYGPRFCAADGTESFYCIMGVWQTDDEGMPTFFHEGIIGVVVHELCHSYTNRIIDRYVAQLESAGRKVFPHVAAAMKKQGYWHWRNVMYESLVRACVVRYTDHYYGEQVASRVIESERQRHFLWIGELSKLLAEYETNRGQYPTWGSFMPQIVTFFDRYAAEFDP